MNDTTGGNPAFYSEYMASRKIVEKYGDVNGITPDLMDHIENGTASEQELTTFSENADTVIDQFKKDMRTIAPENYTDQDAGIVLLVAGANDERFRRAQGAYSKVVPAGTLTGMLSRKDPNGSITPPGFNGFNALDADTKNLTPTQTVTQLGLDYTGSAYVANYEGDTVIANSLFVVKTPLNDAIRQHTRTPVDPRILSKWEAIANDSNQPEAIRAEALKMTNPRRVCVCVRYPETITEDEKVALDAQAAAYEAKGFNVQKGRTPPFTGNTAPQYGETLENDPRAYADIIQERMPLNNDPIELMPGATVTLKVMEQDEVKEMTVATWKGGEGGWKINMAKVQLMAYRESSRQTMLDELNEQRALSGKLPLSELPADLDKNFDRHFIDFDKMANAQAEGNRTIGLATKLTDELEGYLKKKPLREVVGDSLKETLSGLRTRDEVERDTRKRLKKRRKKKKKNVKEEREKAEVKRLGNTRKTQQQDKNKK